MTHSRWARLLDVRNNSHTSAEKPCLSVLVVDDDSLIRWSIAETLRRNGHTVVEASTGAMAVQALAEPRAAFDAVLLEYRLPDSTDLSLLASLRRLAPRTAAILMTAYVAPDVRQRALDLGAYRVLGKPFDMGALQQLVVDACRSGPA